MATYAVGDVQGCMSSFERLLELIQFRPGHDRLWLAGDLVNRGPRSLDVLRWVRAAGDAVVTVLGNHDVHLLARAAGVAGPKKRDTLDDVLAAPDRDALVEWLAARPLVHREGGFLLVHAGLLPAWDEDAAAAAAREVEAALRGPERARLLAEKGELPPGWRDDLPRWERVKLSLAAFTRLRVCDAAGRIDVDFDGGEDAGPRGFRPWFAWRARGRETILHGHWSVIGFQSRPGRVALDSGCVWGGALTAMRLEDSAVFHQPSVE